MRFALAAAGPVSVVVYDVLGKEVARLAKGPYGAGEHSASLDVSRLAPGLYVVRLASGGAVDARQIVVAR